MVLDKGWSLTRGIKYVRERLVLHEKWYLTRGMVVSHSSLSVRSLGEGLKNHSQSMHCFSGRGG